MKTAHRELKCWEEAVVISQSDREEHSKAPGMERSDRPQMRDHGLIRSGTNTSEADPRWPAERGGGCAVACVQHQEAAITTRRAQECKLTQVDVLVRGEHKRSLVWLPVPELGMRGDPQEVQFGIEVRHEIVLLPHD